MGANSRAKRFKIRPEIADTGLDSQQEVRTDVRMKGWTEKQMEGRTDIWKFPPASYRSQNIGSLGPLPKKLLTDGPMD